MAKIGEALINLYREEMHQDLADMGFAAIKKVIEA